MIVDRLPNNQPRTVSPVPQVKRNVQQAQETIFDFLLEVVKVWPADEVLTEFKRLFVHHTDTISSTTLPALYEIVFANDEEEFRNTLKRSCYILVNNWGTTRQHQPIRDLVKLFEDPVIYRRTVSPTLKRLRTWLASFAASKDYQDLKLFAARYDGQAERHWSERYTSYLLISQYLDTNNPVEQREAAKALSQQLKNKFKFDLAMYTAKSQSAIPRDHIPENPTSLGDEVLRLIKIMVLRRGAFSYTNLASIFLKQVDQINYQYFKISLERYLIFALPHPYVIETIQTYLSEKLQDLYSNHHDEDVNGALLLRTCNRVVDYLTTEDRETPSQLFCLLLSQGNPLPLVTLLLKINLICRNSRTHLEARIADLVRYYEAFSPEDCQWVINFFEVFKVTFAIYTENIEYSLVRTQKMTPNEALKIQSIIEDLEAYRIFSQLKRRQETAEVFTEEKSEDDDHSDI